MKLKDLIAQYGEYEVDSKCVVGECEIERIVIDLTKPKPKSVWDLEKGDNFACVNSFGDTSERYPWEGTHSDEELRSVGNAFLTKDEALRDVERRKVETLLLKCGGRRWFKNGKENWFITFDRSVGFFRYVYTIRDQRQGTIYFDTEEQARQAVKDIGENRIEQTLFEVR